MGRVGDGEKESARRSYLQCSYNLKSAIFSLQLKGEDAIWEAA
jgi:hypothetical protein